MKSGNNDEVDPSVLESLDDSTSSSDIPKSKLDTPSYTEGRKLLDFESPVVPGRDRNIALLVEEEGQDVDLKVAIKERLSHTVKSDTYVSYRICTDVSQVMNAGFHTEGGELGFPPPKNLRKKFNYREISTNCQ